MSSDANMVTNIKVLEHLGNSDHNIIIGTWFVIYISVKVKYHIGNIIRLITMQCVNGLVRWTGIGEFNGLAQVEEMWNKF